jgi:pimeloyl-ACP methyl ester carboxylesterase
MPSYVRGHVETGYDDVGAGPPLLVIPGGGLNSTRGFFTAQGPFDPAVEFGDAYRCITPDLRNARGGSSAGPLEVDRSWDSYTDDHLALMDHLGVERFLVIGFCIGAPLMWNLIQRAPDRIAAAVFAQPSGYNPEWPNRFYDNYIKNWVPTLLETHPGVTQEEAEAFLHDLYRRRADFVFTVSRAYVGECETPILVLPDDTPPHPFAIGMDMALLSPNSQVSLYPWAGSSTTISMAVRHVRMFLDAHQPAPIESSAQPAR